MHVVVGVATKCGRHGLEIARTAAHRVSIAGYIKRGGEGKGEGDAAPTPIPSCIFIMVDDERPGLAGTRRHTSNERHGGK